jgi:hypothetical protein
VAAEYAQGHGLRVVFPGEDHCSAGIASMLAPGGGANTKLFHAVTNGRRTNNFIPAIKLGEELLTDQNRKNAVYVGLCRVTLRHTC